ncbi:MAG: hypothetical protein V1802_03220 [Candidatus Aenigmatarchaeota archaeon]
MAIYDSVEEVKVKKGIGIWNNTECVRCGACCYEWNKYLHQSGAKETEQCKNFVIRDAKAYCLVHNEHKSPLCQDYFCGDTGFTLRVKYGGDEMLRDRAKILGTVPPGYKIPKPFPRSVVRTPTTSNNSSK